MLKLVKRKILFCFILLIVSMCFFICNRNFVFSQSLTNNNDDTSNAEIKDISNQIEVKKDLIKKKQDQRAELQKALITKQSEKADLANQLAIIDNRLEKSKIDIENTQMEVDKTNLEIKKVLIEIDDKNNEIENEKNNIADTMNLMYKQDGVSSLEIILLNKSLSDFLNQVKYLENINSEIKNSLNNLFDLKSQLEKEKISSEEKNKDLDKLKNELIDNKNKVEGEQQTKIFVLDQTKSSEQEYQRLIRLAKQEQQQASNEIINMEKSMREKLAQLSKDKLGFNDSGFNWPVTKNTVTSYFHDPDYPFRRVFEHPAVDIRASQGTPIRAAVSGYVATAKNAGMGYSYIMIVHGDGLSTVYGHVSKIYVSADEYVTQGQVIGASGGLPGTPGAGSLTTGAHLHFEVRLNGIPVNPLEYLP